MANWIKALSFVTLCLLAATSLAAYAADSGLLGAELAPETPVQKVLTSSGALNPQVERRAKAIRIYLHTQKAYLTEFGKVVKTYQISSGAPETPTPKGVFHIFKKQPLRVSSLAVPYRMPNYMAFTENEAFGLHALPYLGRFPEGSVYWQEAQTHIGIPVSHGCIRFLPAEAQEIYAWADVGIPVFIHA